jgi:tumor protein p53-inducible protein 3
LDLIQAAGKYPPPPGESDILGVEVSGIVAELSPEAAEKSGLAVGDCVFALIGGGGYADFCTAPYQTVMKVPEGVSMEHAAGIAETYMTAYSGLFWSGRLVDGETLLIHAGASGVGLAAIQLAKSLVRNVTVIVTAGSEEKLQVCAKNGADLGINYKTHNFADEVLKATGNKGTDVVLDFIGGSYFDNHTKCMALDGRLVLLGLLGGAVTQSPLNLGVLLRKRLQIVPSTLRSRGLDYKHQLSKEISAKALPLFASKQLNVVVDSCFSLEESSQAHQRMKENKNIGKIVISFS